jgi:hypothetical protein
MGESSEVERVLHTAADDKMTKSVLINRPVAAAAMNPSSRPTATSLQSAAHHESNHLSSLRAERDAYADLRCPLRHRIRDDRIQTDGGEHERNRSKHNGHRTENSDVFAPMPTPILGR